MTIKNEEVGAFLDSLGAKTPTPGGGAVAGLTAALGIALGRMVLSFSEGRKSLAEHAELHASARERLDAARGQALELADADAAAYARMNELWKLPEDDARRRAEMPAAVQAAIDVPRRVMTIADETLDACASLLGRSNKHLASDLAMAAILAEAAARSAAWNVRINLPMLADDAERTRLAREIDAALASAAARCAAIESGCA